jgi:protocatechuate 3,4-dioxygenase beta subunit
MVSLRRRQVIIGGLAATAIPAWTFATERNERLILSGRVVGRDGKPLAGAIVAAGSARTLSDADGRFVLVTARPHYRVSCEGRALEGFVANRRRDADGTWRATVGLTLA